MEPVFTLQWPEFLLANRLQKLLPKSQGYSVLVPASRQDAVPLVITELNRQGTNFRPNISRLMVDFSISSDSSGAIAFVPDNGRSGNRQGYDLVKISAPDVPDLGATLQDVWECVKEHYGLTTTTVAAGIGGVPISKRSLGHFWAPKSSKYTNLVSHLGLKFFPRVTLPHDSAVAKLTKNMFGSIRVFGIVGRAMPYMAVGLAVFDAISIGMCVYEARNGRR